MRGEFVHQFSPAAISPGHQAGDIPANLDDGFWCGGSTKEGIEAGQSFQAVERYPPKGGEVA